MQKKMPWVFFLVAFTLFVVVFGWINVQKNSRKILALQAQSALQEHVKNKVDGYFQKMEATLAAIIQAPNFSEGLEGLPVLLNLSNEQAMEFLWASKGAPMPLPSNAMGSEENLQKQESFFSFLLTSENILPNNSALIVANEQGGFVGSIFTGAPNVYDPRKQDWYLRAKENKALVSLPAIIFDNQYLGMVSMPVLRDGAFLGVVGLYFPIRDFFDFPFVGFAVDPEGTVFFSEHEQTNPDAWIPHKGEAVPAGIQNMLAQAAGMSSGIQQINNAAGEPLDIIFVASKYGWQFFYAQAVATVNHRFDSKMEKLVLLLLLGLGCVCFIVGFWSAATIKTRTGADWPQVGLPAKHQQRFFK